VTAVEHGPPSSITGHHIIGHLVFPAYRPPSCLPFICLIVFCTVTQRLLDTVNKTLTYETGLVFLFRLDLTDNGSKEVKVFGIFFIHF
jgi:hypothetical protein